MLLLRQARDQLDPLQFAYNHDRGTDDATILITHDILEHLEKPDSSARILFLDFSSALNTVRPSLMYQKLISLCPLSWYAGW